MPNIGVGRRARTAADLNVSVVNRSDLVSKLNLGVTRYGDTAIEAMLYRTLTSNEAALDVAVELTLSGSWISGSAG